MEDFYKSRSFYWTYQAYVTYARIISFLACAKSFFADAVLRVHNKFYYLERISLTEKTASHQILSDMYQEKILYCYLVGEN